VLRPHVIGRWSRATSASPQPSPNAIVVIADVTMPPKMRAADAPKAIRSANSRVRRETATRHDAVHADGGEGQSQRRTGGEQRCGELLTSPPSSHKRSSRLEEVFSGCSAFTSATFRLRASVNPSRRAGSADEQQAGP